MRNAPACNPQIVAFLSCLSKQPTDHFECDEGKAAIKEGFCDNEQASFAACITAAQGPEH